MFWMVLQTRIGETASHGDRLRSLGTVQLRCDHVAIQDAEDCIIIDCLGRVLFSIGDGHRGAVSLQCTGEHDRIGSHVIGWRERAKHIDIPKQFKHETIQNRQMRLIKVGSSNQLADIFTKPLQLQQLLACRDGILTSYCLGSVDKRCLREGPATPEGARHRHYRGCEDGCCCGFLN